MTRLVRAAVMMGMLSGTALAQTATPPPPPPVKPVTETYFGTPVTDRYRYMENLDDPAVQGWMKAEGRYTRAVLDSIPDRARLLADLTAFTGSFDAVKSIQRGGDRLFYEERAPGSDNFDLLVRERGGAARKLVDVAALRAQHGGKPYAINYFAASPDGGKVAVGLSAGGSEDASLFVYDTASAKLVAGPLPRAQFGVGGWSDDGALLYITQLADLPAGAPTTEKYQNSKALVWDLKNPPVALLGGDTKGALAVPAAAFPVVTPEHGSPLIGAIVINGVQNEVTAAFAPAASVGQGAAIPWQTVVTPADGVTRGDVHGRQFFLLSHKDAPTFQVLAMTVGQKLAAARVLIPAAPDRVIEGLGTASDALYVWTRRGLYSELLRVPYDGGAAQTLALPFKGSIGDVTTDPATPGVVIAVSGWTHPPTALAYRPGGGFTDLKLGSVPASYRADALRTSDLGAAATDGVIVPLSLTEPAGPIRPRPVLLSAYGSYGISEYPQFSAGAAFATARGIATGTCHVRGGGELGETWRLGGKDATKANTWRDLIACADYLVKNGYTTPAQLFIVGGSAGGITMGRALEERPDLFAGVIDAVPVANPLRQEFSPNGVPNIPEFGSVKTEAGFRNLLMMDSVQHVVDGTHYPAVMITTGLNDPRVSSWEPAKFAARLRTSGTTKPVLLRVEEEAGHGIGSTKAQNDAQFADIIAFVEWRSGLAGAQPTAIASAR